MHWPAHVIGLLWLLWALYWAAAAFSVKSTRQREPLLGRVAFIAAMALVAALLSRHWPGVLEMRLIPGGWVRYGIAVLLVVTGLAFSVRARQALGKNWSGTVTIKVDHELVQAGPYRRWRHPIYSGLLLALLGSGLAAGRLYGLLGFLIAFLALWLKSRREERWMAQEFKERYERYRRTTWGIVPFVR